jgi:hypothetical protein
MTHLTGPTLATELLAVSPVTPDTPHGLALSIEGNESYLPTPARARENADGYERGVDAAFFFDQPQRSFWPRRRRRRRKRAEVVPHLRHGRLPAEIERMLARPKPELVQPDDAEIERLLAKHADIAGETSR